MGDQAGGADGPEMTAGAVRELGPADLDDVLGLLSRRAGRMAAWAPRLWRPAADAARVLRAAVERQLASPEAVRLGTADAVLLGVRRGGVVDQLESATDDADELARLLVAAGDVRVFTPLADAARVRATAAVGLVTTGRWFVRDLPQVLPVAGGRLAEQRPGYTLAPSPPLHDPGGPVAVVSGATSTAALVELGVDAAARGARVAVVVADATDRALADAAAEAGYAPLAEVRARRS